MIFSCGENWEAKKARWSDWHPFFALWPRTIAVRDGKDICAWLQWIERKGEYIRSFDYYWWWEYRLASSSEPQPD